MQQWLVNNPQREAPSGPLPDHPIFDTYRKLIGPIEPSDGDYEHFVEDLFRFHSAIESFGIENCWIHHQALYEKGDTATNAATGEVGSVNDLLDDGAIKYGAQRNRGFQFHSTIPRSSSDDYHEFDAFTNNAGRLIEIGGYLNEDEVTGLYPEGSIVCIFDRMVANGVTHGIAKRLRQKLPLVRFDLKDWETHRNLALAIDSDYDPEEMGIYTLLNDEETPDAFLVQEVVQMRYEYRTFVVGHEVVSGAACIEEFTPLDGVGEAFDSRFREWRSKATEVVDLPEVRDRLVEFAKKVSRELALERPDVDGYTLDVCLDENDKPLVVEFNGHTNAGFYANQPKLFTDALARTATAV